MLLIKGHRSQIRDLAFSPDGSMIASCAGNGYAVSLWDAFTGKRISYLSSPMNDNPIRYVCFTPDNKYVIAGNNWFILYLCDVKTTACEQLLDIPTYPKSASGYVAASGAELMFGKLGGTYRHPTYELVRARWKDRDLIDTMRGPGYLEGLMAFEPGSGRAAVTTDQAIHIHAQSSTEPVHSIRVRNVRALDISPDGQLLAYNQRREITILDMTSFQVRHKLKEHTKKVNCLRFSPDGRSLISGSHDETVRIFDTITGEVKTSLNWEIGPITHLAIAADGMRAAVGGLAQIMIWDLED